MTKENKTLSEEIEELKKEIEKLVKMFEEEEGSLWASENETYIEDKINRLHDLNTKLQQAEKNLERMKTIQRELKDRKNYPFLKENCPCCGADRTIIFEVIDKIFEKHGDLK